MYERFTDRARKVMQLANVEAVQLRHEYIGTEHVLLGLVKEGSGVAANVLKNLGVELTRVEIELKKVVPLGPAEDQVVMGRLPHTPRIKQVFDYATEEARWLNHNYVGTEHLLLGLLRQDETVAAKVIVACGATLLDVREEVFRLLGKSQLATEPAAGPLVNPRLYQPDAFALVRAERAYQDAKWGAITEHPHEVGAWLLVMKGKLDAAIAAWQGTPSDTPALGELVKAVAVGVACLEQHGGNLLLKWLAEMEFTRTNCGYMSPSKRSLCYWPVLEAIRDQMKKREEKAHDAPPQAS